MACIGIDLGTTNSLVTCWRDGKVELIPNDFGEYMTPSVVGFTKDNQVLTGKAAREMLISEPDRTFREFKRTMGTGRRYYAGRHEYSSEELSSMILRQLKADAERYLGEAVTEAIISVPAYFSDSQRSATRMAGKLAGLKVDRIINEPSAAALLYHIGTKESHANYLIFDFGGGTLDVSLVEAFDNIVEIEAVSGDNQLGGKNFNEVIAAYFYDKNDLSEKDLNTEDRELVYREAEICKIMLSEQDEAERRLEVQGKSYVMHITKKEFKRIAEPIFHKMILPIQKVLSMSGFSASEIDHVVLVGGSSKMPLVQELMESLFVGKLCKDQNPDEIVALGIGMLTGIKAREDTIKDYLLSDICPFSLGTAIADGSFSVIIERNEILPCSKSGYYTTVGDMQTNIDFEVYQGEDIIAAKNELLTTITIEVPPKPRGEVQLKVEFSYDINGIFDINIICKDDGNVIHKTIVNENVAMSEEELQARIENLEQLRIKGRDETKIDYLLYRANRIYKESGTEARQILEQAIADYRYTQRCENDPQKKRENHIRFMMLLEAAEREQQKLDISSFLDKE